jgi:hypothetical protein
MATTMDSLLPIPGFADRKPMYVIALNNRAWAAIALGDLLRAHQSLAEAGDISTAEDIASLMSLTQHHHAWLACAEGGYEQALQARFCGAGVLASG